MLTLIILLILFIGIYAGVRRGLVLQIVYTLGYIVSFFVARNYYLQLSERLELFIPYSQPGIGDNMVYYDTLQKLNLDLAFYNAVAFLIILAAGWLLTRIIGYMLNSLTFLPILKQVNNFGGALLGFLMQYFGIFLALTFLTFIPFDFIQNQLANSGLANWIIKNTPILSQTIYEWWIGVITV